MLLSVFIPEAFNHPVAIKVGPVWLPLVFGLASAFCSTLPFPHTIHMICSWLLVAMGKSLMSVSTVVLVY